MACRRRPVKEIDGIFAKFERLLSQAETKDLDRSMLRRHPGSKMSSDAGQRNV
jgi:hypothetical protein